MFAGRSCQCYNVPLVFRPQLLLQIRRSVELLEFHCACLSPSGTIKPKSKHYIYVYICEFQFIPAFVHSIVLRVHADVNEGFMTCSIYGGSRAQYFRTHRGETLARAAIVVWWKGFFWSWYRLFSRFICVGDNTIYTQFCGQKFIWDFQLPRGRGLHFQVATSVAGGIVDPVIYIIVHII